MSDGFRNFLICWTFAMLLLRSILRIRRHRALARAAAEFLRANGVSSMVELRAKVEASRERHRYTGPPTGLKDVSSFAEGRKAVGQDRS